MYAKKAGLHCEVPALNVLRIMILLVLQVD